MPVLSAKPPEPKGMVGPRAAQPEPTWGGARRRKFFGPCVPGAPLCAFPAGRAGPGCSCGWPWPCPPPPCPPPCPPAPCPAGRPSSSSHVAWRGLWRGQSLPHQPTTSSPAQQPQGPARGTRPQQPACLSPPCLSERESPPPLVCVCVCLCNPPPPYLLQSFNKDERQVLVPQPRPPTEVAHQRLHTGRTAWHAHHNTTHALASGSPDRPAAHTCPHSCLHTDRQTDTPGACPAQAVAACLPADTLACRHQLLPDSHP